MFTACSTVWCRCHFTVDVGMFKLVDDPVCPERILRACRQQTLIEVSAHFTSFYFHIYLSLLRFDSYFIARYFVHVVKTHRVDFWFTNNKTRIVDFLFANNKTRIVDFGLRIIKHVLSIFGLRIIKHELSIFGLRIIKHALSIFGLRIIKHALSILVCE